MKKFYVMFAVTLGAYGATAQTLITYGTGTISKNEFWRAYNKNKQVVTDKGKSVNEYVDLYTNFKLKVKAAQDLRLDTLQQIQYDLDNFRNQIMENYLSDDKGMKRLQEEAFERSQKDVHVIHFSVPVDEKDTAKAAVTAKALYEELKTGKTNYAEIVKTISEKNGAAKQSDIGFITAFTVPYEYENIIYNTQPGSVSQPYRTKSSWHIFKVIEEKPDAGKWKIAQILFTFPPDADDAIKSALKKKADSVYNLLQNGASFDAAAKTYSDDKLTFLTGGELPEFNAGKFSYAFESEVFKLKKDGEISKPFVTNFGYHIVKRISQVPVVTNKSDETNQFELKQKVMADARINIEREKFAKEILTKTGFKTTSAVKEADLMRYADTLMKDMSVERTTSAPFSNKTIATFSDNTPVKGSEWLKFVRDYKSNYEQYKGETNQQLWDKFQTYTAVEYYKKHLENYNEDFKFQMQEFKEGNMLFEVMERNVWNKAIADVPGLQKYYAANKEKYKWAESADVLVFNCTAEKVAADAIAALKAGKNWKAIMEGSNAAIQADSGRYEIGQIIGAEAVKNPAAGSFSNIIKNIDGSVAFVQYLKNYPAGMQRNFEEARGLVINDYQNVLEQQWLQTLKAKYPVKVNQKVLDELLK